MYVPPFPTLSKLGVKARQLSLATVASNVRTASAEVVAAAGVTLIDQLFAAGVQSFNFTLLFAVHAFLREAVVVPSGPVTFAPE